MHSLNIYGVYSYNRNSFSGDVRCLAVSPGVGYIQGSKPKVNEMLRSQSSHLRKPGTLPHFFQKENSEMV